MGSLLGLSLLRYHLAFAWLRQMTLWNHFGCYDSGSGPVWTNYLPVMTTVQGVSQLSSHGQLHQSACMIVWLTPRNPVLGWVIPRINVLGFVYVREVLQSPLHLYINVSTKTKALQLGLLDQSPFLLYTRESSLCVTLSRSSYSSSGIVPCN